MTRALALTALCLSLVSCRASYFEDPSHRDVMGDVRQTVYLLGDFGTPSDLLEDVTAALAEELATLEDPVAPRILELGDNLYASGFSVDATSGSPEVEDISAIANLFMACRWHGEPVPLFLLPGNHDHDGEALEGDRAAGDITRWYFLDELGLEATGHWTMLPGTLTAADTSADALFERVYDSPEEMVVFMAPRRIPDLTPGLAVVAVDSQMLLDLYRTDRDDLAQEYLERLRIVLGRLPNDARRALAVHHPLETHGKHRPMTLGRLLLGPGYPQFAGWKNKLVALPPVGTLVATAEWIWHDIQDIHSGSQRKYRNAIYELLAEERVSLVFAGHDHGLQLIDLRKVFDDPAKPGEPPVIQIVSGGASKIDPVARGKGTIAYHSSGGYVRLVIHGEELEIEFVDRHGQLVYRYVM